MFGKKQQRERTYTHCWSEDPAFDKDHPDFDHSLWLNTGEQKHIPCLPGAKPVEFTLRRLTVREREHVIDLNRKSGEALALGTLVRMAVYDIDPFKYEDTNEKIPITRTEVDGFSVIGEDTAARLFSIHSLWGELAARIEREEFSNPT